MRNIKNIRDKFEFSLDARQISVLFFLSVLVMGLIFTIGVMYGKGLKKVEMPDIADVQKSGTAEVNDVLRKTQEGAQVPQGGAKQEKEYTFYETLQKGVPPPGIQPSEETQKQPSVVIDGQEKQQKPEIKEDSGPKELSGIEKVQEKKEAVKPKSTGIYVVQVVAYNDREKSRAMVKKLKSKGYKAFVEEGTIKGKRIFRVKVGYFDAREEAEKAAANINKNEGLSTLVTR
ncbi:MAG TPA: SPOR domain-containing protein [bacterium]